MENAVKDREEVQEVENLIEEDRVEGVEVEVQEGEVEVVAEAEPEEPQKDRKPTSKDRIDRLTKLRREAERREQDALKYAESVKRESEDLKARLNKLDQGYVQEYSGRVESELEAAKNNLRQAMSIGDTDAAVEAQQQLASLTLARERALQAQSRVKEETAAEVPAQQAQPEQPPQRPDPKAEAWADKNEWFGKDQTMTYAAFGIHKQLIEDEGFDPASDEYYSELDRRIAEDFSHKLGKPGQRSSRPVQTVASASRTAKTSGPRKVKLTASQVAIAKKLGVPLEEYAKYVKE